MERPAGWRSGEPADEPAERGGLSRDRCPIVNRSQAGSLLLLGLLLVGGLGEDGLGVLIEEVFASRAADPV